MPAHLFLGLVLCMFSCVMLTLNEVNPYQRFHLLSVLKWSTMKFKVVLDATSVIFAVKLTTRESLMSQFCLTHREN